MSKEAWFREYERIGAEAWNRGEDPYEIRERLANEATEALRDRMADQADRLRDEEKHR